MEGNSADRHWHTKVLDTWEVAQLKFPRQESVKTSKSVEVSSVGDQKKKNKTKKNAVLGENEEKGYTFWCVNAVVWFLLVSSIVLAAR